MVLTLRVVIARRTSPAERLRKILAKGTALPASAASGGCPTAASGKEWAASSSKFQSMCA